MEFKRLLDVLDKQLEGHDYVVNGHFSVADIVIAPWISAIDYYKNSNGSTAREFLEFDKYANVGGWLERVQSREAFKLGKRINGWGEDALDEYHSE